MENFKFRKLKASEIECRIGQVNKGGVQLLLYMDARAAQSILDESVGPNNWQNAYSRDNANCVVQIWDPEKNLWISKENTGTQSNTEAEKGLASDSFKRACVLWGIGRELYSAPKMFVGKDKLPHYTDENGKQKCTDAFDVRAITYTEDDDIASVTIAVTYFGREENVITFNANGTSSSTTQRSEKPANKQNSKASTQPQVQASASSGSEDEIKEALGRVYALAPSAGTSVNGVNEWIEKKFHCEVKDITLEQVNIVYKALEDQAKKKSK